MNLWDRFKNGVLIAITPFFLMCEDPNEIGAELNPNNDNVNALYTEFTLPTSIVFSDSVATNRDEYMAFGVYEDPIFGRIKSTAFFQFGIFNGGTGPPRTVDEEAEYDSAVLYLQNSFYFGEDFTGTQNLAVHSVADTLFNVIYKSTVRTPFIADPVAEAEFIAQPDADSLIRVDINDNYGMRLLNAVRGVPLSDISDVLQFEIPGIAIVPSDDMEYIYGIEPLIQANDSVRVGETSTLRVYYHLPIDSTEVLFWDYVLDGSTRYMKIDLDRSNSELSGLTNPFEEYESVSDDRYVNPISGINTKIDMSPVWDFIDSLDGFLVNKAEIEISPVFDRGGVDDYITTLTEFSLLFTDDSNKINGNDIFNTTININNQVLDEGSYLSSQTGSPLRVGYFQDESLFRGELSNYLQAAGSNAIDRRDLMLYPIRFIVNDEVANTFSQLIFNKNDIRIKLFYTTLQ